MRVNLGERYRPVVFSSAILKKTASYTQFVSRCGSIHVCELRSIADSAEVDVEVAFIGGNVQIHLTGSDDRRDSGFRKLLHQRFKE